jgi:Ser/Thr protein kinase RdoA (MazF antagonist)
MGMEQHTQGQEDLLEQVMRAFGISTWENHGPVAPSRTDLLGLLVEVDGILYILKERAEGFIGEESTHRYDFQNYLRQVGIPIPPFRLNPQREPVVAIGEETFELQQWVEGEAFRSAGKLGLQRVAAAGAMLGRIHQASQRYAGPVYRWPSEAHAGALVQGWLNLARGKAEESEIQAIAAALSHWCDQWEAALPTAMMSIGSGRGLPEFHIHGDYSPLNLRFDARGVSAVMGLEASRWEKRLIELAYALFSFSALEWQQESTLTRPLVKRGLDPASAHAFLEAYSALCPPVPGEALLLADALILVAPIVTINGPLEDLFYQQPGMDETPIDDVMERLHWASSLPTWLARTRRPLAEMW